MGRVLLFFASSLDGRIATEEGGVDWLFSDQDYGYTEFYAGVDRVACGRKTWEVVCRLEAAPYADKQERVIYSRTLDSAGLPSDVRLCADALADLRRFRAQGQGTLWIVGGAELHGLALANGLVDELVLSLQPTLLGRGIPQVTGLDRRLDLELLHCRTFDTGLVQLRLRPRPTGAPR